MNDACMRPKMFSYLAGLHSVDELGSQGESPEGEAEHPSDDHAMCCNVLEP